MVKLRALKTFSAGGAKLTMQGDTFDATQDRANEYIRLELAEQIDPNTQTSVDATGATTQAPADMTTEFAEETTPNFAELRRGLAQDNPEDTEFAEELGNVGENTEGIRTDYTENELGEMNVKELRAIAKNNGVTGYSTMTKSELIFAIRAHQNQGGNRNE
jgi:hypothetical protein